MLGCVLKQAFVPTDVNEGIPCAREIGERGEHIPFEGYGVHKPLVYSRRSGFPSFWKFGRDTDANRGVVCETVPEKFERI